MSRFCLLLCLVAFVCGQLVTAVQAAGQLKVVPSELRLQGAENRHRLMAERFEGTRAAGQVDGEWTSSNPLVAVVERGLVIPTGNGTTMITVKAETESAQATVTVSDFAVPHVWSFRNHVQAVLAKSGCNSGACHGTLAGKGGFRLSLRGYDPASDFHNIVKQQRGRRIELADPGQSLVLTKPTGALPHKGGLRFETDSLEYRVIAEWIGAGAIAPSDTDSVVDRLEILPDSVELANGAAQDLLVRAHFSNGRVEDVTRWVKFTSADEAVAKVDNDGRVAVIGPGEGAITAWYASKIVISRVTSPFTNTLPDAIYQDAPKRNFIDELVLRKLKSLKLKPSAPASDSEFIRRAYVDTIGTLPTLAEARAFLDEAAPDKRDRVIESLLARPEFVDYWSYRWSDLLLINGQKLRPKAVHAYYRWVHKQVASNAPWDEFARQIVMASGSSLENGATNFYALHQDPEEMAETVSQAFMGLGIGCAKCHNHPLEKWTNSQYYAFANHFARVRAKGWGGDFRGGDGSRTLYVAPTGDLIQPLTGKAQPPTPLDGVPLDIESPDDRRVSLAAWLTSPQNTFFSRSITNRVWAAFFGAGLVEQVDDMRVSNPASNEELLATAAQHLVDSKFDLKSLMRTILQSHTYQRSSVSLPENRDEKRFYSRYYPKRMMAEVLLDALSQVSDVPTEFNNIAFPGGDREKTDAYKLGTRAIQLHDSAVDSYFLKTFGRNNRAITCECERSEEPNMVQVLHIANGETLNAKLKAKEGRLTKWLTSDLTAAAVIEELFLTAVARHPTEAEKQQMTMLLEEAKLAGPEQHRQVLEDICWSVLSTREFLFNH